jgi:hypothetical protein
MSNCSDFLWPNIRQHLLRKYNVVAEIDLLDVDSDPGLLYQSLKAAYKEQYAPQDRILIYHHDTDYYHNHTSPGFTLSNLFSCLSSLDISVNFCLLITNHYGIRREIDLLSHDELDMPVFESSYMITQTNPAPEKIDINIQKIRKPYVCLNGARRSHRVLFLCYLKEYQLLDQGILSWHFADQKRDERSLDPESGTKHTMPDAISFVTTTPFTRVNDRFDLDISSRRVFDAHADCFSDNFKNADLAGEPNHSRWHIPAVQEALVYVSVETVLQYPYPFLTEKTFRPILLKRPFVILGSPGSLTQIKKLGFKTFDGFWDEDYDHMQDPNQRMRAVAKIVNDICSLSSDQLQQFMHNLQHIVEFNYQFYDEQFSKQLLNHRLETL